MSAQVVMPRRAMFSLCRHCGSVWTEAGPQCKCRGPIGDEAIRNLLVRTHAAARFEKFAR